MSTVRMRALRTVYISSERKEYSKGQEFSVLSEDVDALVRRKKAVPTNGAPVERDDTYDVAALRAQYREVTGRPPFNGWGAEALREKIGQYRTTHMVAKK